MVLPRFHLQILYLLVDFLLLLFENALLRMDVFHDDVQLCLQLNLVLPTQILVDLLKPLPLQFRKRERELPVKLVPASFQRIEHRDLQLGIRSLLLLWNLDIECLIPIGIPRRNSVSAELRLLERHALKSDNHSNILCIDIHLHLVLRRLQICRSQHLDDDMALRRIVFRLNGFFRKLIKTERKYRSSITP